jgi:iron complex outermembrane receptor protein
MVLKRNMLSVALMSATMLLVGTANAQEATDAEKAEAAKKAADAETIDKVTVKGIRRGIENAIETKQTATSIVESISAEDIGKLPDASIADSIARLPGLTAQRERGRATQINIRGFAGDFAGTTLNGREQVSLGDNRGVEFDQYPSELLSGVTVYKTPDASLVGQGLSGTVDLQTVKPLSFGESVVAMNYRYDQNEVGDGKKTGGRYSFSYIDQFADNTVGIALGYAHQDSPSPGLQAEQWGYCAQADAQWCQPSGGVLKPGESLLGGGKVYQFDSNNTRDGFMGVIQFKPSEFYETSLDVYYSKFKKTEIKSGLEFGFAYSGALLQPGYTTTANGIVSSGTMTGVKPVLRMDSNPIDDKLFSMGWNHKFKFNDNWSANVDFAVSSADRNFKVLETYAGLKGNGTSTVGFVLNPKGYFDFTFNTDLSDPNNLQLIDAGNWGQDGYIKNFNVKDELQAFRIDATRTFDEGFLSSVEFGFNITDRHKSKSSIESKLCITTCTYPGGVKDTAPFPGTSGSFSFAGINGLAIFDAEALLNSGFYNLAQNFNKDIANKNWEVDETVKTFYVQANLDTNIGDMPLRGNFGFQYVDVNQSSSGFSTFAGNPAGTPTVSGTSYNDFLPSLNLSLGLPADQYLRFAAAKQVARARMDDLRASYDVSVSVNGCANVPGPIYCGGGGNPKLKPWEANAFDMSYEKYFETDAGNKGYFSVAYFYKDLLNYIRNNSVPFDYAGQPLPPPTAGQTPGVDYPASTIGVISQPINDTGGVLKGLELTASLPLDYLWAPLDGFGIQASYSDTTTNVKPFGETDPRPLPGFSKYVSNITAYYENNGFSIRYSQRSRSKFLGETRGFGADLGYVLISGETVQDAQINYTFGSGTFENLSLYLQVSNIGDEPFRTTFGGAEDRPKDYFEYGRQTLIGFSYKF